MVPHRIGNVLGPPFQYFEERYRSSASTHQDNSDGTYTVSYTPHSPGTYKISVEFLGTFQVMFRVC